MSASPKLLNLSSFYDSENLSKEINILNENQESPVIIRGFVSTHRVGKSVSFIVIRQGVNTIQCVYTKKDLKKKVQEKPVLSESNDSGLVNQNTNFNEETAEKVNNNPVSYEKEENKVLNSSQKKAAKKLLKAEKFKKSVVKTDNINDEYILYNKITPESFVEISGLLFHTSIKIKSASICNKEIQVLNIKVISECSDLPFLLKDVFSNVTNEKIQFLGDNEKSEVILSKNISPKVDDNKVTADTAKLNQNVVQTINVSINKLLDNRSLSLRHIPTHNLFKAISMFYSKITSYLTENDFIQIKTPKLIESSSEGGANLFNVSFFNRPAFLAQSPQLYKQMAIIGGLQKVFEIGHVYRAEESNINRYLSEFIGVDLEMEINDLDELINNVWKFLTNVFDTVKEKYSKEIIEICNMFGENVAVYSKKPLIFTFTECRRILEEDDNILGLKNKITELNIQKKSHDGSLGETQILSESSCGRNGCMCSKNLTSNEIGTNDTFYENLRNNDCINKGKDKKINLNDFSREEEKKLGRIIKEKYGTDLFCIKKYPTAVRAFYTKPIKNVVFSESYDFILRGEEILSGAIRINDYNELLDSIKRCEINEETLKGYLESFKIGVPLHGGCGIGFERTLKQFFGGKDIRLFTMFPRDPTRLFP